MKILIAVITYNEEENIARVLQSLSEASQKYHFDWVVIDNCSTDRTVAICREVGSNVISHCVNTGGSFGTVMTYFQYAYELNYDIVCQFDGDGQHLAEELPKIITPILEGNADLVIGSRFLTGDGFQSSFLRRIGIRTFALLDSLIIRAPIKDVTSGFRAYGIHLIKYFVKYYRDEIYDTNQLILMSHFSGARILEVPVLMQARTHGVSEYNLVNALVFPVKGLMIIFGCLLQKSKITKFQKA